MLSRENIEHAAERLQQAERSARQISALTLAYPEMTMDDAYAIQKCWVERKIADGDTICGYKIGLTSRAMQLAMKIDEPDFGVLMDSMKIANQSQISAADFPDPRIEVELAFVMKKRLSGSDVSIEDVLDATDYIVPSLELIAARCHRTDPQSGYVRTICDTVSDNAANAGIVIGDHRIDPSYSHLPWIGAVLELNGRVEETGLAAGVLGHPANGVAWVCRRFAPHGVALEAGQIVLAGSFTRPVAVTSGDSVRADFGKFGQLSLSFS